MMNETRKAFRRFAIMSSGTPDAVRPWRQTSVTVRPHSPQAGQQLSEQVPFAADVDSLSIPRHRHQLPHRFEQALGCNGKSRRVNVLELASLMPASWNRIDEWLRQIEAIRQAR